MKSFILSPCLLLTIPSFLISAQVAYPGIKWDSTLMITARSESDHFIWIGTNEGVYKINKQTGRNNHFTAKNSRIPSNHVTSIACSPCGQAYIGTKGGIFLWDNYSFLPITAENSNLPDDYITALALDKEDNLWIGTFNEGLIKAIGNPIKVFKTQPIQFNNESISCITVDATGCVWVTLTNGNFACLKGGEWHSFPSTESIESIKREMDVTLPFVTHSK